MEQLKNELAEMVINELKKAGIEVSETSKEDLMDVPVNVSARHVHLSRSDMDSLFGQGSILTMQKGLSQPGQFAAAERVTVSGPKGEITGVRVLGPLRRHTQVEVSPSDARRIGVNPPVRSSGSLEGTPGVTITGPAGSLKLEEGCIIAERHIHMTCKQARERGLTDGQNVQVKIEGSRGGMFDRVHIRARDDYAYDMHIDTDEANALLAGHPVRGKIII